MSPRDLNKTAKIVQGHPPKDLNKRAKIVQCHLPKDLNKTAKIVQCHPSYCMPYGILQSGGTMFLSHSETAFWQIDLR